MRLANIPEMSRHTAFLTFEDSEDLKTVIERMAETDEHTVIATSHGRLSGIFTDRDLSDRVMISNADIDTLRLRDVMTQDVLSARVDEAAFDTLGRMGKHVYHNIPVIDAAGRPAGLLRIEDLSGYSSPDLGDVIRKDYEPILIAGAIMLYALATAIVLYVF